VRRVLRRLRRNASYGPSAFYPTSAKVKGPMMRKRRHFAGPLGSVHQRVLGTCRSHHLPFDYHARKEARGIICAT